VITIPQGLLGGRREFFLKKPQNATGWTSTFGIHRSDAKFGSKEEKSALKRHGASNESLILLKLRSAETEICRNRDLPKLRSAGT